MKMIELFSKEIFNKKFKDLSKEEFKNSDINNIIISFSFEFALNNLDKIKNNIIQLNNEFAISDHKLFKIIKFCQDFDLDDIDILNQMWSGVENAWSNLDNEELYEEDPDDPGWFYHIDMDRFIDSHTIKDMIYIVKKFDLDIDDILDEVNLYEQVQNAINSYNHARLYYDNQLYYDEKIEAIEEAYNNL